jgi:hypothetical protein
MPRLSAPAQLVHFRDSSLQVRTEAQNASTIRASAHNGRIVNVQALKSQAARRRLLAQLSLAPLRLSLPPRPTWTEPSFLAEFGDSFLEQTGLEGGSMYGALRVMVSSLEHMLKTQRDAMAEAGLGASDITAIQFAHDQLNNSIGLFKKVNAGLSNDDTNGSLTRVLKFLSKELQAMTPGKVCMCVREHECALWVLVTVGVSIDGLASLPFSFARAVPGGACRMGHP